MRQWPLEAQRLELGEDGVGKPCSFHCLFPPCPFLGATIAHIATPVLLGT